MKKKSLTDLIEDALTENKSLLEKYGDYPPVFNSKNMLEKISGLISQHKKLREIKEREDLNIGLLASKSLDLESDQKLVSYGKKLHSVWSKIMPIRLSRLNQKQKLAYSFFLQHGIAKFKISGYLAGIDFNKLVKPKILLISTEVYQWDIKNEQGNYYAEDKNDLPQHLGINENKEDQYGRVFKRKQCTYKVHKTVVILFSYAAAVLDTWSVKGKPVKTKGGSIQYFNRGDKHHFIKN